MKKRSIRILLSILLVAVVTVGGTLAYMVATDNPLINTFALADVHTEIDEPTSGTTAEKDPKVENIGESPVYVRARVVISGGDAEILEENNWITITYNEGDEGDWVNGRDGFYYYKQILQPKAEGAAENPKTEPLFTDITVSKEVSKEAQFSVDVYQESVLAPADSTWTIEAAKAAFNAKG